MPNEESSTVIYNELRKIARNYMRRERIGHSLQPTALVHEAYVRMLKNSEGDEHSRTHFLRFAARAMREILVEHARARLRIKRGGGIKVITLIDNFAAVSLTDETLLALEDAMARLEIVEPRAARIVEMRFFSGMTEEEIAQALEVSLTTVKREWTFARAWLRTQLAPETH